MASDINHYICTGRLTADAQGREVGKSTVFSFSIAINHYEKKESKDVADFFNVTMWANSSKQADYYKDILVKGSAIVIEGSLRQERWEKDGQKQSRISILASSVAPMGAKKGGESSDSGFPSYEG